MVVLLALALALLAACTGDGAEPGDGADGTGDAAAGETPAGDPAGEPDEEAADEPETGEPAAGWVLGAEAPTPLTEVAAAAHEGRLWAAGGYDDNGVPVAGVQIYDPAEDSWSEGPPLPEPRHHAALVSIGDQLYLLGGYATPNFEVPSSTVWVLDGDAGAWQDGPSLAQPRAAGAAAFDGERIVYGGGVGPGGLAGDIAALSGERWQPVGELSVPREHLAAASDGDGRVFFLAGRTGGLDTNLATVDLVEGERVSALGELPTPRGGLSGFYAQGVGACAAGGEQPQGTFTEVECIGADGEVTSLPELVEGRHGIGAAAVEDEAFVLLGGPEPGLTVSPTVQVLRLPRRERTNAVRRSRSRREPGRSPWPRPRSPSSRSADRPWRRPPGRPG